MIISNERVKTLIASKVFSMTDYDKEVGNFFYLIRNACNTAALYQLSNYLEITKKEIGKGVNYKHQFDFLLDSETSFEDRSCLNSVVNPLNDNIAHKLCELSKKENKTEILSKVRVENETLMTEMIEFFYADFSEKHQAQVYQNMLEYNI